MSNFVETFKELIRDGEFSILSLENKIGISNAQLGKYLSGKYMLSIENAIKISKFFDCSLDYLCGLDEIKIA